MRCGRVAALAIVPRPCGSMTTTITPELIRAALAHIPATWLSLIGYRPSSWPPINILTKHQAVYPASATTATTAKAMPARTDAPAPTKKAMQKMKAIKRAMGTFYESGVPS